MKFSQRLRAVKPSATFAMAAEATALRQQGRDVSMHTYFRRSEKLKSNIERLTEAHDTLRFFYGGDESFFCFRYTLNVPGALARLSLGDCRRPRGIMRDSLATPDFIV